MKSGKKNFSIIFSAFIVLFFFIQNHLIASECHNLNAQLKSNINDKYNFLLKNKRNPIDITMSLKKAKELFSEDITPIINSVYAEQEIILNDTKNKTVISKITKKDLKSLSTAIFAQMAFETAWFTSSLTKENNFAGLKFPGYRGRSSYFENKVFSTDNVNAMSFNDQGDKTPVIYFDTLSDGLMGYYRFLLLPVWNKKNPYVDCLNNYNSTKKLTDDKRNFLNCIGKGWAASGISGDYGVKAFGSNDSSYDLIENYIKNKCVNSLD